MEVVASSSLHARALLLPENLTVRECAAILKIGLKRTRKLLKSIYYKPRNRRKEHMTPEKKLKQQKIDWSTVDWSKRNIDLHRETGISLRTIVKRRKAMT